ncbi:MAG: hypothetical protein P4L96_16315 [Rhodoferax sp.]|nr:hypothetical protein [Rhodoferax sp.]
MRITFWASLLLALFSFQTAQADDPVPSPNNPPVVRTAAKSWAPLEVQSPSGAHYSVWVTRDASIPVGATPDNIEFVAKIRNRVIVFIDSYPSISGGMSYCQAGHERFLRIASIARPLAIETFHVKVESCRDNIELASPGIEWLPESATLRIHWLQGPDGSGTPEARSIHIGPDAKPD